MIELKKVIIDVGASKNFLKNSVVSYNEIDEFYMFEPHPTLFKELYDYYLNKSNVHLWNFALSDKKGVAKFYMTKKEMCSSLLEPNKELNIIERRWDKVFDYSTIEVPTYTLDSILRHLTVVDLLKIDTQGSEFEILKGATNILKVTKKVTVEVEFIQWYKNQKLSHNIEQLMEESGFKLLKKRIGDGGNDADFTYVNSNLNL